jgi:hypothetical protein
LGRDFCSTTKLPVPETDLIDVSTFYLKSHERLFLIYPSLLF